MADWSLPRKARKSNFSTDEVDVLVDSVKTHYNVLYGKFAKRATNRWIRQKAWLDILKKVNGVSIEKRTLQEVKNKWKKCQYAMKEKATLEAFGDDAGDSSWDDVDSMPLQERLSKVAAQEKIAAGAAAAAGIPGQILKSQPLSPTKLKVTRSPKVTKPMEPPPSPVNEEMCLRWNSHHSNMQTAFPSILSKEQYVDVTLAAEGKTLKCHRLILSSCSPYFEEVLNGISPFQHPVLFMRDIPFWILKSLCDFMYAGEVHIFQNKLEELLTVAEALKIKGLAGKSNPPPNQEQSNKNENNSNNNNNNNTKEIKKKPPQHHEKEKPQIRLPPIKKQPIFTRTNNYESTSHDYDDDLLDPLDLLEPLYEEAAEEKKPSTIVRPKEHKYQYQPIRKPFARKLRKRKFSEHRDPSPPPVFSFRKGTRSRPNVKIPKYYHTDFTNPTKPPPNAQSDPLLDVDEIKTEPIDVEDNLINYSDEDHFLENSFGPNSCDSPIIITSAKPLPQQDKFKKIRLTKPIITEVHTIEETSTTAGGLEVFKITVQQPGDVRKKRKKPRDEGDPLQSVIITENAITMGNEMKLLREEIENEDASEPMVVPVETILHEGEEVPEAPPEEVPPTQPETVPPPEEETEIVADNADKEEPVSEEANPTQGATERETNPEVPAEETDSGAVEQETGGDAMEQETTTEVSEQETGTEEVANNNKSEESDEQVAVEEMPLQESEEQVADEEMQIQESEEQVALEEIQIQESEEQVAVQEIQIQDVRSTASEEIDEEDEEERRTTSLDHLEKEAMNVANAINLENQAGPPDIE